MADDDIRPVAAVQKVHAALDKGEGAFEHHLFLNGRARPVEEVDRADAEGVARQKVLPVAAAQRVRPEPGEQVVAARAALQQVVKSDGDVDDVDRREAFHLAFARVEQAGGEERDLGDVAEQHVVVVAAPDHVCARLTGQNIVARARRRQRVVAAEGLLRHLQRVDVGAIHVLNDAVVAKRDVKAGSDLDQVVFAAAKDNILARARVDHVFARDAGVDRADFANSAAAEGRLNADPVAGDDVCAAAGSDAVVALARDDDVRSVAGRDLVVAALGWG